LVIRSSPFIERINDLLDRGITTLGFPARFGWTYTTLRSVIQLLDLVLSTSDINLIFLLPKRIVKPRLRILIHLINPLGSTGVPIW
jgi:hypothetical protein